MTTSTTLPARGEGGPSDRALVTRACVGDGHAFTALMRRHQGAVRGFLRRFVGDAALADDIAQETFVQAHRALASFRGDGAVLSWLLTIAYRKAIADKARARHRHEVAVDVDAPAGRGEERTSRTAERDVQRALATLPPAERAAIALCFLDELTHDEAAQVMGVPLGTLKSHVARGKEKLKALLAAYATSPTPPPSPTSSTTTTTTTSVAPGAGGEKFLLDATNPSPRGESASPSQTIEDAA